MARPADLSTVLAATAADPQVDPALRQAARVAASGQRTIAPADLTRQAVLDALAADLRQRANLPSVGDDRERLAEMAAVILTRSDEDRGNPDA